MLSPLIEGNCHVGCLSTGKAGLKLATRLRNDQGCWRRPPTPTPHLPPPAHRTSPLQSTYVVPQFPHQWRPLLVSTLPSATTLPHPYYPYPPFLIRSNGSPAFLASPPHNLRVVGVRSLMYWIIQFATVWKSTPEPASTATLAPEPVEAVRFW